MIRRIIGPTASAQNSDDDKLRGYADELFAGIADSIGPWVEESIQLRLTEAGIIFDAGRRSAASAAARRATEAVCPMVRELLESDVDEQRTTPLTLLRTAVRFPTEVLLAAGVPPVQRDDMTATAFPDDIYDLSPASFADLSPELLEPGIAWGAAKAHVIISRRKS